MMYDQLSYVLDIAVQPVYITHSGQAFFHFVESIANVVVSSVVYCDIPFLGLK